MFDVTNGSRRCVSKTNIYPTNALLIWVFLFVDTANKELSSFPNWIFDFYGTKPFRQRMVHHVLSRENIVWT